VPRFLSPEWVDALNAAAARVELDPALRIAVHHRIGGRGYTMRVAGGRAVAALDAGHDADITFTEDEPTALALARGETTAQQAISDGRLKVGGDIGLLVAAADGLAALSDVLSGLATG
jgi:putative sterol carrier protein